MPKDGKAKKILDSEEFFDNTLPYHKLTWQYFNKK